MHLVWNVWLTLFFHWLVTITATESISSDIQPYENLIPYSQLYQACIDQNLQSCDILNYEDVEKRSPAFNAWGGKRAKFSSWGGKRDYMDEKRAKFNSWGGKRGSQFSSWGGKRDGNSLNEVSGRNKDFPDKLVKLWGGRWDTFQDKRAKFNSWGGKRAPKFSSWGGKRSPELFEGVKRDKFYAPRKPAFSNWGGKRNDGTQDSHDEMEEYPWEQEEEHTIRKRETSEEEFDGHMPDLWKEFFDRISNPNFNKNHPYDLGAAVSTVKTPVKKSPADTHLQRLFKQFVYWTGNQPEEKKNTLMNSRMFKELNASPMRRGSPEFFNWGGKRSQATSQ